MFFRLSCRNRYTCSRTRPSCTIRAQVTSLLVAQIGQSEFALTSFPRGVDRHRSLHLPIGRGHLLSAQKPRHTTRLWADSHMQQSVFEVLAWRTTPHVLRDSQRAWSSTRQAWVAVHGVDGWY